MNGKLLSQLPDFLCENELVERLKILPNYNINIANETMPTRLLALSELYDIYIPSQLSVDVYNKLYMALLRSIKKKENDMMVKQQRIENTTNTIQTYNGIIGGADSFTIIGVSGIGKSSAITRVQFTTPSGLHSVLERPFSEANGRPFLVKRSPLIVC